MKSVEKCIDEIQKEFAEAARARLLKNEGKVRVCARRAVGIAIAHHYESQNKSLPAVQALDLMKMLHSDTTIPEEIRDAVHRLSARVTPDFTYAFSTDPIADAKVVVDYLIKEVQ